MKQLYGNNAVVVSGSNSIPMMSSQSLASMVQVSQICKLVLLSAKLTMLNNWWLLLRLVSSDFHYNFDFQFHVKRCIQRIH